MNTGIVRFNTEKIVFVPACLLCPALMARKIGGEQLWRHEIITCLNNMNFSIIQMPCPEATFPDLKNGLNRKPHGIMYYENLNGFEKYCHNLGDHVVFEIESFFNNGFLISAILGIEHSPTCAVNYMYTNNGTEKRQGIFVQYLKEELEKKEYCIPFIGINRRYPKKAIYSLTLLE